MNNKRQLYTYFGHHKCATTWIDNTLSAIFLNSAYKKAYIYDSKQFEHNLSGYISDNNIDILSYVNADFSELSEVEFKGFHVIRDPRDIIVSGYFSHYHSHPTEAWPELIDYRKELQGCSKDEGMMLEIDFEFQFIRHMLTWDYSQANILELKLEELTHEPYKFFIQIFEFLNLLNETELTTTKRLLDSLFILPHKLNYKLGHPIKFGQHGVSPERLLGKLFDNRFVKISGGRKNGTENKKSHYRRGVAGDWKNHFTEKHKDYFKDKYGDIVVTMGYESNNDW
jgi:hypothetical protein